MSDIDQHFIDSYRTAEYRVYGSLPMTLQIDVASPSLRSLHRLAGVAQSAFITASNPYSDIVEDSINHQQQQSLAADLSGIGLQYIDAEGVDPIEEWQREAGYWVLDCSLEQVSALGKVYRQNAVVWAGDDAVPRLILLR